MAPTGFLGDAAARLQLPMTFLKYATTVVQAGLALWSIIRLFG